MSNNKSFSLRIDEELLRKFHYVADYHGRSANNHLIFLVRRAVDRFQKQHGEIPSGGE